MGKTRRPQAFPNCWSRLGISPRQFSKKIGITFSMAEFVVNGRHSHHQTSGFKHRPKYHNSSMQSTSLRKARATTQYQQRGKAFITSKTTAQRKLKINTKSHATDVSSLQVNGTDLASYINLGNSISNTFQSLNFTKPRKQILFCNTSGQQDYPGKFGNNTTRYRTYWRNPTSKVKSRKGLLCQKKRNRVFHPCNHAEYNHIGDIKHADKTVQVPEVDLNREAEVQISIPQMLSFEQHAAQCMDDGQVLVQQEEMKNKEHFQGKEKILHTGEMKENKEEEEEEEENDNNYCKEEENTGRSGFFGWWKLLQTWLQAMETYF